MVRSASASPRCAHIACLQVRVLPQRGRFEFDTARFESSPPSQPQWSLARDFGYSRKCRYSRRLAVKNPVSGEEFGAFRAEGRKSRGESLLDELSISEIWSGSVQRPVAFPQRPVRSVGPESRPPCRTTSHLSSRRPSLGPPREPGSTSIDAALAVDEPPPNSACTQRRNSGG